MFCEVDPTVAEVFRASKLESLFEFVADRPAALRAISERSARALGRREDRPTPIRRGQKSPRSRVEPGPARFRRKKSRFVNASEVPAAPAAVREPRADWFSIVASDQNHGGSAPLCR